MTNKRIALILLALAITLFLAMARTQPAFALGYDARANGCRTFHLFAHQGGINEVDGWTCANSQPTPAKHTSQAHNAPTTVQPTQPTAQQPTNVKHCNKGEGQGGEGCNPGNHPENGNNDEDKTTLPGKTGLGVTLFIVFEDGSWAYDPDGTFPYEIAGCYNWGICND